MWVRERENDIFTLVKTRSKRVLQTKYPDLYFTQDDEQIVETKLPTVYIHNLPGVEIGQTIDGQNINGMLFTFEIHVTVSKKQGQKAASEVMWEIIGQFKKLRFSLTMSPEFINSNNASMQQIVARVRRPIGASDNIQH